MRVRSILLLLIGILTIPAVWAWDKGDWEEVNFEFNSSILVDGFPSMLQMADILSKHPDYRIDIVGHCDSIGGKSYNDALALKRAETVSAFLVKYGAQAGQITASGKGFAEPRSDNATKEGRFMNRRVVFSLYVMHDGRKELIRADAPISSILREMDENPFLKRLDAMGKKQDDILNKIDDLGKTLERLKALQEQQAKMAEELNALYNKLKDFESRPAVAPLPPPPPVALPAEHECKKEEKGKPDFTMLGASAGVTREGDFTGSASARYFHPLSRHAALQAEGEFVYMPDRLEYQVDFGLVKRYKAVQIGAFASLKRVEADMFDTGGTLGQASFMGEYIFSKGSIGFFLSRPFKRESVVSQESIGHNLVLETYLSALDQYGFTFQVALPWKSWVEGNAGWVTRDAGSSKPGGLVRWVKPIADQWGFFVETGWNESLISDGDTPYRVAAGVRYGLWKRPAGNHSERVEPMAVPRVKYEVLSRTVRTGNDSPIANAGADVVNVKPGTVVLDGTASYDPDGDPLTYLWVQISGPAVALTGAETANPSFTAAVGNVYVFKLKVADPSGQPSWDEVSVSTLLNQGPVANAGADRTNVAPGLVILDGTASYDPDNGPLTYLWTQVSGPGVAITDAETPTPSFNAAANSVYVFKLKVTDSTGASAYDEVSVSTIQNRAPVAVAGPNLTGVGAGVIYLNGSASYDPDGDAITFQWTQIGGPGVTIEGAATATPHFTVDAGKNYAFRLKVTDPSGLFSYSDITISTVSTGVNTPPVAFAGFDQIFYANPGTVTLNASGSYDPDGDSVTFRWEQVEGPAVTLDSPTSPVTTFTTAPGIGGYVFKVMVTDSRGLTSVDTVYVFIL